MATPNPREDLNKSAGGELEKPEATGVVKEPLSTTSPASAAPLKLTVDPFADLAKLALSQDFAAAVGVTKLLTKVPIQKPNKVWWVRTHPDDKYWFPTTVIELKADNETYLVTPDLRPYLTDETTFVPKMLVASVARPNNLLFLWSIALPGPDGKLNPWHASAMDAAIRAKDRWVRVQANMQAGGYDVATTEAELPPPKWPEESMADLLRVALKGRVIDSLDHPVLRCLRGEV